jgi:hypothetical protein
MSIYISCTSACLEINLVLAIHEHVARGSIFWPGPSTTRPGWVRARSGPINHAVPRLPAVPARQPGSARHKTVRTGSARCRGAGHKAQPPPSRPRLSVPLPHGFSCSAPLDLSPLAHPRSARLIVTTVRCTLFFPFRVSHEV